MERKLPNDKFFNYEVHFNLYKNDTLYNFAISRNTSSHFLLAQYFLSSFLTTLCLEEKDLNFIRDYLYPSQPLLYYRFALTYLSYLYIFNGDENKAREALEQTEKRCVIKDFWRWIIKEAYPFTIYDLSEWEWPRAETCLEILFFITKNKSIIIPHWAFLCKKEYHYLNNYEYTLKGWEKTEAQKLYSQGEVEDPKEYLQDIEGTYNMETCEIEELDFNNSDISTVLSYVGDVYEKGDVSKGSLVSNNEKNTVMLAALPSKLTSFLIKIILDIKKDDTVNKLIKELEKDKTDMNLITLFNKKF
jgi:hypothetical protein